MKSQFLLLTTSYSRERLWNFQFNKIRKTYQLTYYFTRKITNFFREIISKGRVFTNFNELRNPQFFMWIWSCDFANSNFSLLNPLISRVSRIFWIRNPDELLTFIWISFFSGGSKSTQTRQRSSAGKRRWSRSKFHAAMVEPLYHIVITVWYCKNRCYKKEINKNLVVPNPMPIRTPNFSINHDNLLFLILAAPKKGKTKNPNKSANQICF